MERLTVKRKDGRWAIANNDGASPVAQMEKIPLAVNRLAANEDTGLEPEEITTKPYGCVFYCNRKCNLDGDFCAEGPGCPHELMAEDAMHLLELAQAEKDGRLVVHGKWMPTDYMVPYGRCSVCQHESKADDYGYVSPYCPWCGAKMESDNDS